MKLVVFVFVLLVFDVAFAAVFLVYNIVVISSLYVCMAIKYIIVLFVETPRKFITAKLSIRKPGSSSVLYIYTCYTYYYYIYILYIIYIIYILYYIYYIILYYIILYIYYIHIIIYIYMLYILLLLYMLYIYTCYTYY